MQAGVQSDGRSGVARAAEIDLGALGRALWRKKLLIAGLTLLAAAIAFAAVNLITPRYKSEARVLIETRENIFFRPDAEKTIERGTTVDQEAVTSQVQLILSRDLAREGHQEAQARRAGGIRSASSAAPACCAPCSASSASSGTRWT